MGFASFILSQNYVWIADADSTACTDGMVAGRKESEKLWEKTYKSNCQYVTEFANELTGCIKQVVIRATIHALRSKLKKWSMRSSTNVLPLDFVLTKERKLQQL